MQLVIIERDPNYSDHIESLYNGDDWSEAERAVFAHLANTATDDYSALIIKWWNESGRPLGERGLNPSFTISNGQGKDTWQVIPTGARMVGSFQVI